MVVNAHGLMMVYVMSLHPLQKKPFFVHGLGAITCFFLFHTSNIQMTYLHCPFQGWHLYFHKHSHCWPLLCKSFVSHNFYTWFSNLKDNPNKIIIKISIKTKRVFPSLSNKNLYLFTHTNYLIIAYIFVPPMHGIWKVHHSHS